MYTKNSEALDYIYDFLTANKTALGLNSVWYGDDNFAPPYPAAVVVPGGILRTLHSTRTFEVQLTVTIFVFHANFSASHRTRTREDLLLSEAVRALMHTKYTFDGNIVWGFIQSETPGVTNTPKGVGIVSTSLVWSGESREQFGG